MRDLLLLATWLLGHTMLMAQSEVGPSGLFDTQELFTCTLTADLEAFLADRGAKAGYQPATISYQNAAGDTLTVDLKFKVRGHYRRDPLVCYFPPVKLNFDKDADLPAPWQGQNKLKLVTHCHEDQYIFREYYLYRVFGMLTDSSFRVRLAQITYRDIHDARPPETRYAFLIESEDQLAERLGVEEVDDELRLKPKDVDQHQLALVHMFNYMIANRDFDIQVRQNVKIFSQDSDAPLVVPYDFDWSGMVNAPYTKLTTMQGPVYKKRQRYQALCLSEADYESLIAEFEAIRPAIWDMYRQSPYLTPEQVKETLGYYKYFFRLLNRGKTMDEVLRKGCP